MEKDRPHANILWVDEDMRALASAHRAIFARHPEWQVSWVNTLERAIRVAERNPVDVLLTETVVAAQSGVRFLSWFTRHQADAIALVVTARPDLAQRRSLPTNVQRVLLKPVEDDVLIGCIERALRARSGSVLQTSAPASQPSSAPAVERRGTYRSAIASSAPLRAVQRVTRRVG
ncbi:MAG: hypothetical protein R3B13_33020 [Polyangiaceae bacterium]